VDYECGSCDADVGRWLELQVRIPSSLFPYCLVLTEWALTRTQTTFVHCNQLNALEGFAWSEWCVKLQNSCSTLERSCSFALTLRILVTITLIIVLARGISVARRGDGYRGGLVP
jgi:hypothetical protein